MSAGNLNKLCRAIVMSCAAAFMTAGVAPTAFATSVVNDNSQFELDGNTTQNATTPPPEDWATVLSDSYAGAGVPTNPAEDGITPPAGFKGVIPDPGDVSIYTGGGSKDVNDIGQWRYKNGSVPDKDNLTNAFAVAYQKSISGTPHLVVYFGADRFAVNGDSEIGFWFFQQNVKPGAGGRFVDAATGSTATHTDGDLLILADFTIGGSVGTIKVYVWQGGANGSLNTTPVVSGGNCAAAGSDDVCALINTVATDPPWPYVPKSGPAQIYPPGAFFEGGIDITDIFAKLGRTQPCFASFLAETRSSQSPTATLKDFVLGGFPVCSETIAKACVPPATFNPDTNLVHTVFNVPVKNTGLAPIYEVTITEDKIFNDSLIDKAGSICKLTSIDNTQVSITLVDFPANTPTPVKVTDQLNPGVTLNLKIECDSSRNPLPNKIFVKAKSAAGASDFDTALNNFDSTPSAECSASPPVGLKVEKSCKSVTLVGLTPKVCVDITLTNTGNQDLTITKLNDVESIGQTADLLADFKTANGGSAVLQQSGAAGDSATVHRCYTPTAGTTDEVDPRNVTFTDVATAAGTGLFDQHLTGDVTSNPASCNLCPPPQPLTQ